MKLESLTLSALENFSDEELKTKYPEIFETKCHIENILDGNRLAYDDYRNNNSSKIEYAILFIVLLISGLGSLAIIYKIIFQDLEITRLIMGLSSISSILFAGLFMSIINFALILKKENPQMALEHFYFWPYEIDFENRTIYKPFSSFVIHKIQLFYTESLSNLIGWNSAGLIKNTLERKSGSDENLSIKKNQADLNKLAESILLLPQKKTKLPLSLCFYAKSLIQKDPETFSNPKKGAFMRTDLKSELAVITGMAETTIYDKLVEELPKANGPLHIQLDQIEIKKLKK